MKNKHQPEMCTDALLFRTHSLIFSEFLQLDLWDEIIIHQGQFLLGNKGKDCFQIKGNMITH